MRLRRGPIVSYGYGMAESNSEALVRAQNVSRFYRSRDAQLTALADATCTIYPRDRIALTGPSGSGKSTLLQILADLDRPSTGTVDWPGLGISGTLRPAKIAYVFQAPSLLAPLNAVENVEVPLLIARMDPVEARRRAHEALEIVGLTAVAEKLPEELSGGQASRIAFARALASRPALLFADEPTGQLDHPTAERLLDSVLDWLQRTGSALVVATHDEQVAERLAIRWNIEHGHLKADAG